MANPYPANDGKPTGKRSLFSASGLAEKLAGAFNKAPVQEAEDVPYRPISERFDTGGYSEGPQGFGKSDTSASGRRRRGLTAPGDEGPGMLHPEQVDHVTGNGWEENITSSPFAPNQTDTAYAPPAPEQASLDEFGGHNSQQGYGQSAYERTDYNHNAFNPSEEEALNLTETASVQHYAEQQHSQVSPPAGDYGTAQNYQGSESFPMSTPQFQAHPDASAETYPAAPMAAPFQAPPAYNPLATNAEGFAQEQDAPFADGNPFAGHEAPAASASPYGSIEEEEAAYMQGDAPFSAEPAEITAPSEAYFAEDIAPLEEHDFAADEPVIQATYNPLGDLGHDIPAFPPSFEAPNFGAPDFGAAVLKASQSPTTPADLNGLSVAELFDRFSAALEKAATKQIQEPEAQAPAFEAPEEPLGALSPAFASKIVPPTASELNSAAHEPEGSGMLIHQLQAEIEADLAASGFADDQADGLAVQLAEPAPETPFAEAAPTNAPSGFAPIELDLNDAIAPADDDEPLDLSFLKKLAAAPPADEAPAVAEEPELNDLDMAFLQSAPVAASAPTLETEHDHGEGENFPSLLNVKSNVAENLNDTAELTPPATLVTFDGETAHRASPASDGPARQAVGGFVPAPAQAAAPEAPKARMFDPPHEAQTGEAAYLGATEQALVEALEKLQKLSGG